jgi:D-galactarolactone cycloisomerase
MKITDVKTMILQVPLEQELGFSQAYFGSRTSLIIQVLTDEGISGLGESFGAGNVAYANQAIIERVLKPIVVGHDPFAVEVLWHRMYNGIRDHGQKGMPLQSISGVDVALWDIIGKATGQPLYRLLGGKFREQIVPYAYGMLFRRVPDLEADFAREAEGLVKKGFRALKMKIGMSPADDLRLVNAVREAIGSEVRLMADANHAYTPQVAVPLGRRLEQLGLYWFEEPIAPEDYDGYVEVKNALDIPIAGGECEYTRWGFRELISRRCVDIVQAELLGLGGITEFRKVLALATTWGIPIIPHVWGSSVAVALSLHVVASLPDYPGALTPVQPLLELDTTPNPLRELVAQEPLCVEEQVAKHGFISVPEKPGLGVDLNLDVVRRFQVA